MVEQAREDQNASLELIKKSALGTLTVFKDEPLFSEDDEFDRASDAFNHAAFAETILKLIKQNQPPLSIGLFGAWGIGKSTIINILFKKIEQQESGSLKPIYFNAWKYSADSFRRQFLIEVARQIYGDGHDKVTRLEQLNYTDVLKQSHQKNLAASLVQGLKDAFDVKFAFRGTAVARFVIGCASLLVGVAIAALIATYSPLIAAFVLATVVPAVFIWFSRVKFEELFVFQETPIYDPKLIFPEQFETEFSALIKSEALKGKRAVIAIDDIDRCEPKVVQDILISTKNFIGQENCFFVVPCDDRTIVEVFTEPNQKKGYKDESLRKYFNVGLRIPPITSTDLVDFANTMARKTGIPEGVVQVAVLANCRDARKMKHFLNSFAMKYQIGKARESSDLMPKIVDDNLLELAKAVLIEDAYPDLFAKIVENPRVYQLLERAALESDTSGMDELKSLELENWNAEFPGLKEVLERTRDIPMVHADVFFSLKSTNPEIKVPRGTELRTALIEGKTSILDEIGKGITDSAARTATADLLLDLLNRSRERFLQRAIMGTLRLYCVSNVFSPDDKQRLAPAVISALLYRDTMGILTQAPDQVLTCAEDAGQNRADLVFTKYFESIQALKSPSPPANILTLVSTLYRFPSQRKRFSSLLNAKFVDWIGTREGIVALDGIRVPPDLQSDEKIPSVEVVKKILAATVPQPSELDNNLVRRKILFADWEQEYAESFISTLIAILQAAQSVNTYSPEVEFVIQSVVANTALPESSNANQLWNLLPQLYNRMTDANGKIEVSKAAVVFAAKSKDANVRNAARDFLLNSVWRTLSDPTLRASLDFVKSIESPETLQLTKTAIEQELNSINSELQAPSDRTVERIALCLDYSDRLTPNSIPDLLIRALEVNQDEPLKRWFGVIKAHEEGLSADFPDKLATRCLELVKSNSSRPQRQDLLLRAFADSLGKLTPERKRTLEQQYFVLLKDTNASTRNAAATVMGAVRSSLSDIPEFKISVSNTLGDLRRDVKTQELLQYRPVFDALIAQSDLLGDYQWRDVADLSKRLLSQPDAGLQEYGMALAEAMSAIPDGDQEELLHLLVNVEKSSPVLKDRATRKLDQLSSGKLEDSARKVLENRQPRNP